MNLKQNAVSTELVSNQSHKTSFGTMYACILIISLILMSVAQFFLPVSTIKAEDGKKIFNFIITAYFFIQQRL